MSIQTKVQPISTDSPAPCFRKGKSTQPPSSQISKNIRKSRWLECGYTLIELLAVVGIMGVVASLAVPQVMSAIQDARYARAIMELRGYADQVVLHKARTGNTPVDWNDLGFDNPPVDPWGNEYVLNNHNEISSGERRKDGPTVPINSSFDLFSAGPDNDWKPTILAGPSLDDVIVAGDGQYVGMAEDY